MPRADARGSQLSTGRSVDRLINFSDAVVAVAVTLLALPLIDIAAPSDGQHVWQVVWDHIAEVSTFLFTFYVVAILWLAHNRILNDLRAYDPLIFWLNTTWLAAIVLLPWISAMYGETSSRSSVGLVYWGMLALISFLGTVMGRHTHRNPELVGLEPGAEYAYTGRAAWRGPAFGIYFLVIGLVSVVLPAFAAWMPFGIILLSIWFRPVRAQQPEETA